MQILEHPPADTLDLLVDREVDALAEANVDAESAHGSERRQLDSGGFECGAHRPGDAPGVGVVAVHAERACVE